MFRQCKRGAVRFWVEGGEAAGDEARAAGKPAEEIKSVAQNHAHA